nr:unnamed protein product [Digitaria exilis]
MLGSYGILAIVLVLVLPQVAISNVPSCDSGGQVGSYTANSTFQRNLDLLAATLPGNTSSAPAGFANASVGTSPDQVYALALCRGDINASSCSLRGCGVPRRGASMPRQHGRVHVRGCLRPPLLRPAVHRLPQGRPVEGLGNHRATRRAATKKYFATGEEDFDPKIYGLAQCLPITTPTQCQGCLANFLTFMGTQYLGQRLQWVRLYSVWCSLLYSARPFYEGPAMLQLSAPPAPAAMPPSATPKPGPGEGLNQPR